MFYKTPQVLTVCDEEGEMSFNREDLIKVT